MFVAFTTILAFLPSSSIHPVPVSYLLKLGRVQRKQIELMYILLNKVIVYYTVNYANSFYKKCDLNFLCQMYL